MDIEPVPLLIGFGFGLLTVILTFLLYGMEGRGMKSIMMVLFIAMVFFEVSISVVYLFDAIGQSSAGFPTFITYFSDNFTEFILGLGGGAGAALLFTRTL